MAASRAAAAVAGSRPIPAYARTAGRAVHIKIHPRPLNVSESRQVLRTLEAYGEVTMYKHLKHDPDVRAPNTALAIFGTQEAASRALDASPLRFIVRRAAAQESTSVGLEEGEDGGVEQEKEVEEESVEGKEGEPDDHLMWQQSVTETPAADKTTPSPSNRTSPNPQGANNKAPSTPPLPHTTQEIHVTISPSTQNHAAYISRQHYNGRFTLETRTIMGQDLENRVPVPGLADLRWHVREVPLRVRNLRAEDERKEGRGWWKKGLGEIWREGEQQRRRRRTTTTTTTEQQEKEGEEGGGQ